MNKKKIESLEPLISNIDTYTVSVEHLKVERALNFKERRALKKDLYQEEDGWQFCGRAYVLKNTCQFVASLFIFHTRHHPDTHGGNCVDVKVT